LGKGERYGAKKEEIHFSERGKTDYEDILQSLKRPGAGKGRKEKELGFQGAREELGVGGREGF